MDFEEFDLLLDSLEQKENPDLTLDEEKLFSYRRAMKIAYNGQKNKLWVVTDCDEPKRKYGDHYIMIKLLEDVYRDSTKGELTELINLMDSCMFHADPKGNVDIYMMMSIYS